MITVYPMLAAHLWQSTVFAVVLGLLTLLLRKNHARTRYWVWFAALTKFLVPFGILVTLGGHLSIPGWQPKAPLMVQPAISFAMGDMNESAVTVLKESLPAPQPSTSRLPAVLFGVWACGFLIITSRWLQRWIRVRADVRAARPLPIEVGIPVVSSPVLREPGVFGVFRPVLLLPEGMAEQLSHAEWEAILAHELCHARCYDNLTAAIYMLVETAFWFHPLVWWMGKRLVLEREFACDEEVLRLGSEPKVYAEGILKVCELYLESPLECVPGVTGSNLRRRLRAIMTPRHAQKISLRKKLLLGAAGMVAVVGPIVIGALNAPQIRAQSTPQTQAARKSTATFEATSVKATTLPVGAMLMGGKIALRKTDGSGFSVVANTGGPGTSDPDRIHYPFIALKDLLAQAYDSFVEIRGPSWLDDDLVQVDATMPRGTTRDDFKEMLRNLIVDRFKLRYHVETKEDTAGYSLVLARNGPKIKESLAISSSSAQGGVASEARGQRQIGPDGFPIVANPYPGRGGEAIQLIPGNRHKIVAWQLTMEAFANDLAREYKIRVVDSTGLKAKYDFTMFFGAAPDDTSPSLPPQPSAGAAAAPNALDLWDFPDFFEALQSQLGLRLEARKMPAQVLIVDHVEKIPMGN